MKKHLRSREIGLAFGFLLFCSLDSSWQNTERNSTEIVFLSSAQQWLLLSRHDVNEKALVAFTDMIEWYESPSRERKNFIRRVYPGLRYKEKTVWLCDAEPKSIEYLNESGIVHVAYDIEGDRTDCYYFAPFTAGKHTIAILPQGS